MTPPIRRNVTAGGAGHELRLARARESGGRASGRRLLARPAPSARSARSVRGVVEPVRCERGRRGRYEQRCADVHLHVRESPAGASRQLPVPAHWTERISGNRPARAAAKWKESLFIYPGPVCLAVRGYLPLRITSWGVCRTANPRSAASPSQRRMGSKSFRCGAEPIAHHHLQKY